MCWHRRRIVEREAKADCSDSTESGNDCGRRRRRDRSKNHPRKSLTVIRKETGEEGWVGEGGGCWECMDGAEGTGRKTIRATCVSRVPVSFSPNCVHDPIELSVKCNTYHRVKKDKL